jgi:Ca2+-dependent lipid-binding protein
VEVLNKNMLGKLTPISDGKICLHEVIFAMNSATHIIIDQTHRSAKGDKQQGHVSFTAVLESAGSTTGDATAPATADVTNKVQPLSKTIDAEELVVIKGKDKEPKKKVGLVEEKESYQLSLSSFHAQGLINKGSMLDKQDPCLHIYLGSQSEPWKTARQKDAGTNAMFPEEYAITITQQDYESGLEIRFEVVSENYQGKSTSLGGVSKKLKEMLEISSTTPARPRDIVLDILVGDKPHGTLSFRGHLQSSTAATAAAVLATTSAPASAAADGKKGKSTTAANAAEKAPAKAFLSGQLHLSSIKCNNLKSVEFMGKNDVYIELDYLGVNYATVTYDDIGNDLEMNFLDYKWNIISPKDLMLQMLKIKVYDANTTRANVLIGSADISLQSILASGLDHAESIIQSAIYSNDGKTITGKVSLTFHLLDTSSNDKVTMIKLADDFVGMLYFTRVCVYDAHYVNAMLSNQLSEAYIKLSIASWTDVIPPGPKHNKGNVVFDNLDIMTDVTASMLSSNPITIELWDKQTLKNSMIGSASTSASGALSAYQLLGAKFGQEVEFALTLTSNDAIAGRISAFAKLIELKESSKIYPPPAANSFSAGLFFIKSITATALKNTEIFGKQDPYVKVDYLGKPIGQTIVKNAAGSCAHWDGLDMRCEMILKDLTEDCFPFAVYDDNTLRSDVLIGSGKMSLSAIYRSIAYFREEIDVRVNLVDASNTATGRLLIRCCMMDPPASSSAAAGGKPAAIVIAPSFVDGTIVINRIACNQIILEKSSWFSSPKVKIVMSYNASKHSTPEGTITTINKEQSCAWDVLDMHYPASMTTIKSLPIQIEMIINDKPLASGSIESILSLVTEKTLGKEVLLETVLSDSSKKNTCRLTLNATMMPADSFHAIAVDTTGAKGAGVEESKPPVLNLPATFKQGNLFITSIKCKDLKNTELIGKSDAFVTISLNDEVIGQSEVKTDVGSDPIWDVLLITTPVTRENILNDGLVVKIWDKNSVRADVLIGSTSKISLQHFAYSLGLDTTIYESLADGKGKASGKIILNGNILQEDLKSIKKLPEDFVEGVLKIFRINTSQLKNTELMGKQDPYVIIKVGKDFNDRTWTANNSGNEALFDNLFLTANVTREMILKEKMIVEVWDANATGDVIIGSASVGLARDITTIGEEVELKLVLKDKAGKAAGKVSVYLRLEPPIVDEIDTGLKETLCLYIRKLHIMNMKSTHMLSTSSSVVYSYLNFEIKSSSSSTPIWTGQTSARKSVDSQCLWEMLDLRAENLAKALFQHQKEPLEIKVTCKEKSSIPFGSDSVLGVGSINIRQVALKGKYSHENELFVELISPKGSKVMCKLVLYLELNEQEPDHWELNDSFIFGCLKISRVRAFDLLNTEVFGASQDPYVIFSIQDVWTDKTHVRNNAGSEAVWDVALSTDIYRQSILDQKLLCSVYDKNTSRKDALIGSASISLLRAACQLNKSTDLYLNLNDAKGNAAGRLLVTCSINEPEKLPEIPKSFIQGIFHVKRIDLITPPASMLALSTPQGYIKLELDELALATEIKAIADEQTEWKFLDLEFLCGAPTLHTGKLQAKYYQKQSLGEDKLVGLGDISITRAGSYLEKEVELIIPLKGPKEKSVGSLKLLVQLQDNSMNAKAVDLGLPKDFTIGLIQILKIEAKNIKNQEWFGKQDPYVSIQIDEWEGVTSTKANAGANVVWSDKDLSELQIEVNEDILRSEKLIIKVLDENTTRQDSMLGLGRISLHPLCRAFNQAKDFTIDLENNGGISGSVSITMILNKLAIESSIDQIPESSINITAGTFVLSSLKVINLPKKKFLGISSDAKTIFIKFLMAGWTMRSSNMTYSGQALEWTDVSDIQSSLFPKHDLCYQKLTIEVYSSTMLSGESLVASGTISLRKHASKPNQIIPLKLRMHESRGRPCGTIEFSGKILPAVEEPTLPLSMNPAGNHQQLGALLLSSLTTKDFTGSSSFLPGLKAQYSFQLELDKYWKESIAFPANPKNGSVNANLQSKVLSASHLSTMPLLVHVLAKTMTGGEKIVGTARFPLQRFLAEAKKQIEVTSDIQQSDGGSYLGKLSIKMCFLPTSSIDTPPSADMAAPSPKALPMQPAKQHHKEAAMLPDIKDLEKSIREQIRKEMAEERNMMMKEMKNQSQELEKSVRSLAEILHKPKPAAEPVQSQPAFVPSEDLALPNDINNWRSIHAMAWLAYQLELPIYMDAFQKASVDGLLLLQHIDDDALVEYLGIKNMLHRKKILSGIKQLQDKQRAYLQKKQLQQQLEHQRKLDQLREQELAAARLKAKPAPRTKTPKKKMSSSKSVTYIPMPKDNPDLQYQANLNKTRIARELQYQQKKMSEDRKKNNASLKTWGFEYTRSGGGDTLPAAKTSGYRHFMADDLFHTLAVATSSSDPEASMRRDDDHDRDNINKLFVVPNHYTTDEIIELIRNRMLAVGQRLAEIERKRSHYEKKLDSDLNDMKLLRNSNTSKTMQSTQRAKAIGYSLDDDDEEEEVEFLPPAYDSLYPQSEQNDEDDDETRSLPAYQPSQSQSKRSATTASKMMTMTADGGDSSRDNYEPMTLLFHAFIHQQNNQAHQWLGSNDKLTRLKFYGGLESILKLRLSWSQFDILWTKLDRFRTGDLDLHEFEAKFSKLEEESYGGLISSTNPKDIQLLRQYIYDFAEILKYSNFTIMELFASFSRSKNQQEISLSDFSSLLRTILGSKVEIRFVYRVFGILDHDHNHKISMMEIMMILYKLWKSELIDYSHELSSYQSIREENVDEKKAIENLQRRCFEVKNAIKKNFPRELRDQLEIKLSKNELSATGSSSPLLKLLSTQDGTMRSMMMATGGGSKDKMKMIERISQIGSMDKPVVGKIRDTFRLKLRIPVAGEGRESMTNLPIKPLIEKKRIVGGADTEVLLNQANLNYP